MIKTQLIGFVAQLDACLSQLLRHKNKQFLCEMLILGSCLDEAITQTVNSLHWQAISREKVLATLFEGAPGKMPQAHNTSSEVLHTLVLQILKG